MHHSPRLFASSLLFLLLAMPAHALDLQSARGGGLVAEKRDGYVAAVGSGAEVKALAAQINAARRNEYAKIAAAKGERVEVVAKLAAAQIIRTLEAGSLYEDEAGGWKKR